MFPPILLVKAGTTHPEIVLRHGDYDAWFAGAIEGAADRLRVVRAAEGEEFPDAAGFGGILITGSPASVRDAAPWMRRVADFALDAAERGTPVLGVCFGHQLLGEALGGKVDKNPAGYESGTVEIELTADGIADPLFAGLGPRLDVLSTHYDVLVQPPKAKRLAGSENTAWQAFAAGNVRAVQFHPELRPEILAALLATRGVHKEVRAAAASARVLRNWDEAFVR